MFLEKQKLIHHFLEQAAGLLPDKTALVHEDVRASFRTINVMANQLARWFLSQGVAQGDRIALISENCLEYVVCYYGALKAGTVVAPLSYDLKTNGLQSILAELAPKIIVSSSRFEKLLMATNLTTFNLQALVLIDPKLKWHPAPCPVFSWQALIDGSDSSDLNHPIDESALGSIIYTTGSTGTPKGVMLSHKNIVSNVHAICQYLHLTDKDVQMVVLPFYYVMGKSLLNTHFAVGGSVVINNKFAFPAHVVEQMAAERITGFSGVPTTYAYLVYHSPIAAFRDRLSSLRYCTQAGGHMPLKIKQDLRQVLPDHTEIYIMYGATEASARLTYLEPDLLEVKTDSIGKPIPGVSLRILNGQGQEVSTGQTGEIVAAGPNIMQGYYNDPEMTIKVLDKNGYHTGDLGYQDDEGYFYMVGRKDNLIKVSGHRIHPQEIENTIIETELVIETAVFGIPDKILGHRLVALAVPKSSDCRPEEILSLCAGKLPRFKLPENFFLTRALPRNTAGKIDRAKCLKIINRDFAAGSNS